MATLLLAEVANGALSDMTARALTAALEIGQPVDVLVAGHNVGAAAEAAAKLAGVAKVRVADDQSNEQIGAPAAWVQVAPIIVGHPAAAPAPVPRMPPEIRWLG